MDSVAITDHGAMFGALEFYSKAKKAGIKPIVGCEFYIAPVDRREKKAVDGTTAFHLILESFVRDRPDDETPEAAAARLSSIAARVLADQIPFPAIRLQWLTRFEAAAAGILRQDRRLHSQTLALETRGELRLPDHDFLLYGTPDRIERLPDITGATYLLTRP